MKFMKNSLSLIGRFLKKYWLLCIVLGILLYLILGAVGPFLVYKKIGPEFAEQFDAGKLLSPVQSPDRAMILETNDSAWEERLRLMQMAERRIIISSFDIRDGESTRDLMAMLLHKADEGVDIKILVDGISAFLRMERNELFYAVSSHPHIQIKVYNPVNIAAPWTTQGRMHDKYVIVDDLAYILGGRNMFDYFIGSYETKDCSYDREVLVLNTQSARAESGGQTEKSSLYDLEKYFNDIWQLPVCRLFHDKETLAEKDDVKAQSDLLHERYVSLAEQNPWLFEEYDYTKVTYPTQGVHLLSGQTSIYGKEPRVFYMMAELMSAAKEQVIIHSPYAVCNDYMYETLTEIADTVPQVKLMVNSVANGDNIVASSDYIKNKGKLLDTGVTMYEYEGGISYHGKTILIDDDLSIIGSYNLDLRSTYMDTELMLAIKSEDLTAELAGYMAGYERDCRRVIDENTYETPAHLDVQTVPLGKRIVFGLLGFLLAPFRCVI